MILKKLKNGEENSSEAKRYFSKNESPMIFLHQTPPTISSSYFGEDTANMLFFSLTVSNLLVAV